MELRDASGTPRTPPLVLAPWLLLQQLEYQALDEQWAVVQLLAHLDLELRAPAKATLVVSHERAEHRHHGLLKLIDAASGTTPAPDAPRLWRASFGVRLDVVEYPEALFRLSIHNGIAVALPTPVRTALDPAAPDEPPELVLSVQPDRPRPSRRDVRRQLVTLATVFALGGSSSLAALAAAASPSAPAVDAGTVAEATTSPTTVGATQPHPAAAVTTTTTTTPAPVTTTTSTTTTTTTTSDAPGSRGQLQVVQSTSTTASGSASSSPGKHKRAAAPRPATPQSTAKPAGNNPVAAAGPTSAASATASLGKLATERLQPLEPVIDGQKPQMAAAFTLSSLLTPAPAPLAPAPVLTPPSIPQVSQPSGSEPILPGQAGSGFSGGSGNWPFIDPLSGLGSPQSNPYLPPANLIPIYQAAARRYHVPWEVLAAINSIETDYGRDLSTSSAGAMGWMQFMPATWAQYAVSASGRGTPNPYNPRDAIFTAAHYLAANGAPRHLSQAIFAYNHAQWYVNEVLHRAEMIAQTENVPTTAGPRARLLPDGLAAAPRHAPAAVKEMIAAGNQIVGKPYVFGGAHGVPLSEIAPGYDCSSSVEHLLYGARLIGVNDTVASGDLESFGQPGLGRWVTIFASPDHVFMYVAGLRWDTHNAAGAGDGSAGIGWHPLVRESAGFVARHPAGL